MKRLKAMSLAAAIALPAMLPGCGFVGDGVETVMDSTFDVQAIHGGEWLVVLSVASVVVTDKTIIDHVVSLAYGKDCSTVRYLDGDYYCKRPPKPQPPLYCYRSLADIVCYREPDPYGPSDEVDWPPTRSAPTPRI